MKYKKQIYLALPMDLVTEQEILASISEYKELLKELPVEICSTYIPNDKSEFHKRNDIEIVEDGLELLRKSDILVVDLSKDYNYFGAICEIVYAYQMKIPVIAHIAGDVFKNRPWLNYHVKYVHNTKMDIIASIRKILMIK